MSPFLKVNKIPEANEPTYAITANIDSLVNRARRIAPGFQPIAVNIPTVKGADGVVRGRMPAITFFLLQGKASGISFNALTGSIKYSHRCYDQENASFQQSSLSKSEKRTDDDRSAPFKTLGDKDSKKTVPIEDVGIIVLDHQQITITHGCKAVLLDNKAAIVTCDKHTSSNGHDATD
ncbi:hypothetical protein FHW88_004890 [Mucilaginibacter sp. SG538B]|uniref:hypothetical protein n=1 Tax=Mucilaginibacter sp. SG538B TaxID=2587021 RepID=UPI00159DA03B|nr:hypothetical protein [Mucilaginibacter sp. SG538B]NVM66572.1 hypothetical protein [Mucilaginibacter sp. SG538B]